MAYRHPKIKATAGETGTGRAKRVVGTEHDDRDRDNQNKPRRRTRH